MGEMVYLHPSLPDAYDSMIRITRGRPSVGTKPLWKVFYEDCGIDIWYQNGPVIAPTSEYRQPLDEWAAFYGVNLDRWRVVPVRNCFGWVVVDDDFDERDVILLAGGRFSYVDKFAKTVQTGSNPAGKALGELERDARIRFDARAQWNIYPDKYPWPFGRMDKAEAMRVGAFGKWKEFIFTKDMAREILGIDNPEEYRFLPVASKKAPVPVIAIHKDIEWEPPNEEEKRIFYTRARGFWVYDQKFRPRPLHRELCAGECGDAVFKKNEFRYVPATIVKPAPMHLWDGFEPTFEWLNSELGILDSVETMHGGIMSSFLLWNGYHPIQDFPPIQEWSYLVPSMNRMWFNSGFGREMPEEDLVRLYYLFGYPMKAFMCLRSVFYESIYPYNHLRIFRADSEIPGIDFVILNGAMAWFAEEHKAKFRHISRANGWSTEIDYGEGWQSLAKMFAVNGFSAFSRERLPAIASKEGISGSVHFLLGDFLEDPIDGRRTTGKGSAIMGAGGNYIDAWTGTTIQSVEMTIKFINRRIFDIFEDYCAMLERESYVIQNTNPIRTFVDRYDGTLRHKMLTEEPPESYGCIWGPLLEKGVPVCDLETGGGSWQELDAYIELTDSYEGKEYVLDELRAVPFKSKSRGLRWSKPEHDRQVDGE